MKKKKVIVDVFVSILLVAMSAVLVILAAGFTVDLDGQHIYDWSLVRKNLKDLVFWAGIIVMTLFSVSCYAASYRSRLAVLMNSDDLTNRLKEYEELVKKKNDNYLPFEEFIKQKNLELKKEYYVKKIEKKLLKIEKRMEWSQYRKKFQKFYEKQKVMYLEYKAKIDPKYIEENIGNILVRYPVIKMSYFKADYLNKNIEQNRYVSKAELRFNLSVGRKIISRLITSTLGVGFIAIAGVKFGIGQDFWTMLGLAGFTAASSLFSGMTFSKKIFADEILSPLGDRVSLLHEFEPWMKENDTRSYEEIFNKAVQDEVQKRINEVQQKLQGITK